MSVEARRVVVLSTEAYNQLREQNPTVPQPVPSAPSPPSSASLLDAIPPRFRGKAAQVLQTLDDSPEISWSELDGSVSVNGKAQEIKIVDLLKVICVPFTRRTSLPSDVKRLVAELGIRSRNHINNQTTLLKWHVFFKF